MEPIGAITDHIDVALVVLYAFWLFFFGLVFYLQRESRREGFPLVEDNAWDRERRRPGDLSLATPPKKAYRMMLDKIVYVPEPHRADEREIAAKPASPFPGSPLIPTGNPLVDGVGPASYAPRVDIPERTADGLNKIVPMRVSNEHFVAEGDPDPRGFPVIALDGRVAGTVVDMWVDRSEALVRYLEIELDERFHGGKPGRVLMPVGYGTINGDRGRVETGTITAEQFADVPRPTDPDQVTLREEDRIVAYFAGGAMYATPNRAEPLI